jgi:hypothetical protein
MALGGAAAFFAFLLLFLTIFNRDDGSEVSTDQLQRESSTSSSTSTTVVASTTTIGAGGSSSTTQRTTSTTRAANTTTSSTATTAPGESPEVTGDGAVLQPPATPQFREFGSDCASLADKGGSWEVECGGLDSNGEDLIWLVQQRNGGGELRAYLFRHLGPTDRWVVELAAGDAEGRFSDAVVGVQDASGDGEPEIAYGFRNQGTGQILDLDLVEVGEDRSRVAVHRTLDHGSATVRPGRLDDWAAQFEPGDPNCCPSSYLHSVVRFFDADGTWRIVRQDEVDAAPRGDF